MPAAIAADMAGHSGPHSHGVDGWGDTIFGPELRLAHGPSYHIQFARC